MDGYAEVFTWWIKANHVGPSKTIILDDQEIELPEREESYITTYRNSPGEKLTLEDLEEWEANKDKEQPCTVNIPNWDSLSVKQRLKAVSEGMRGLGSELAQTRQLEGSKYATVATVVQMTDKVKV